MSGRSRRSHKVGSTDVASEEDLSATSQGGGATSVHSEHHSSSARAPFFHYESSLGLSDLETIAEGFSLPKGCRAMVPKASDHAAFPPKGFFAISHQHIEAGFRFPVHPYLVALLNDLNLAPFQLTPNSYAHLTALASIFLKNDLPPPTPAMIHHLFLFRSTTGPKANKKDGFYYTSARKSPYKVNLPQGIGKSNVGDYKSRWFYASCLSLSDLKNFSFCLSPSKYICLSFPSCISARC